MMTFYALCLPGVEEDRVDLLREACEKRKIHFRTLDPYSFDFSKPTPVKKGDMVYRVSRGKLLRTLEDYVLREGSVTFYKNPAVRKFSPFLLEQSGVLAPKSILSLSNDRAAMTRYVKQLGGFPIVVKALGGTRGVGVMKIEAFSALFGIVDFLVSQKKLFTLRQFIPVQASARLIILGDKVVSSMEYRAKGNDFRTNASAAPVVKPKKYPLEVQKAAIHATQSMGLEFGGVDLLIDGDQHYISEVNFPCNFVRAFKVLHQDIAGEMVEYLVGKRAGILN